jgi:membrane protease subunit (stomatin/prohibitin family)
MEIRAGALLKVHNFQTAALIQGSGVLEVFGPGLHTVSSGYSHAASDLYFFSMRPQIGLRWETATPVALGKKWDAVRMRGYGSYAYQLADPAQFFMKVSGPFDTYYGSDLAFHLRDRIAGRMAAIIGGAEIALADLASNRPALGQAILDGLRPWSEALGIGLLQLTVDSLSIFGDFDSSTRSQPVLTAATTADTKFCVDCGQAIPKDAKSCWECGNRQPEVSAGPGPQNLP